jgi:hypothetical protein
VDEEVGLAYQFMEARYIAGVCEIRNDAALIEIEVGKQPALRNVR